MYIYIYIPYCTRSVLLQAHEQRSEAMVAYPSEHLYGEKNTLREVKKETSWSE